MPTKCVVEADAEQQAWGALLAALKQEHKAAAAAGRRFVVAVRLGCVVCG